MAKRDLDWYHERLARRLPDWLAGPCDGTRPSFAASWGGPFDGLAGRTRIPPALLAGFEVFRRRA